MNTNKRSEYLKLWMPYVIFAAFFGFLLFQFRLVGVQYDDYGYYTLNYAMPTSMFHEGTHFTLVEMLQFLKEHYSMANGRLLWTGVNLLVFKVGGMTAIRVMESAVVTVIWLLMYMIGMRSVPKNSTYRIVGAVLLCMCYGLIDQALHQHGTYWHSAFWSYFPMIIFAEVFVIVYIRSCNDLNIRRVILLACLVFASSWSVENWSVGIMCMTGGLFLLACVRRRGVDFRHLIFVLAAGAGTSIMIFSPGINRRLGERELTSLDIRVYLDRMRTVFVVFLSDWNRNYVIFMAVACCSLGFVMFCRFRSKLLLVCTVIGTVTTLFLITEYAFVREALLRRYRTMLLCIALLCIGYLGIILYYFFIRKNMMELLLLFTAFMSMVCLAGVPEVQLRVMLPFVVCSFMVIINAGYEVYHYFVEGASGSAGFRTGVRAAGSLLLIAYCLLLMYRSAENVITTYRGYHANSLVYQRNEARLMKARKELDAGENITQIELEHNVDDAYASVMLYHQDWFKRYIDSYYELPAGIKYWYSDEEVYG